MNQANIRHANVTASAERAELTNAIAAREAAFNGVNAARNAVACATDIVKGAEAAITTATAAIEDAFQMQSNDLLAAVQSDQAVAPEPHVRHARANEAEAQDALSTARQVLATLEGKLDAAERALEQAEARTAAAADAVMRTAPVAQMLADTTAVQEKLIAQRCVLQYLVFKQLIGPELLPEVELLLRDQYMPGGFGCVTREEWTAHPAAERWRTVREALKDNPDVELPGLI